MELNKWEQHELDSFVQILESMVKEDGIIDYRKLLVAKAQLLLQASQSQKKTSDNGYVMPSEWEKTS